MKAPQVILDVSGVYRPRDGYKTVESELDVLKLSRESFQLLWARGRSAACVERLAREYGAEVVALRTPDTWLTELELPLAVLDSENESLRRVLVDAAPLTRRDATAKVHEWLAGYHPKVPALLENADQLLLAITEGIGAADRALLRWLADVRNEETRTSFIQELLRSEDPISFWLGLDGEVDWVGRARGLTPTNPPQAVGERFRLYWRLVLSQGDFAHGAKVCATKIPHFAREAIRKEALAAYRARTPREQEDLEGVCREIFGEKWRHLSKPDKSWPLLLPDSSIDDCLNWFRTYRENLDWSDPVDGPRLKAAQSFQSWFLSRDRFEKWCAEGERGPLCFSISSMVRDAVKTNNVVLLVIVDGLGEAEHRHLVGELLKGDAKLSIALAAPMFSTLPTITDVCKGALLSGRPQREWRAPHYNDMVQRCARQQSRSYYLEGFRGDEVIRRMTNPDASLVVINYTKLDFELHNSSDGKDAAAKVSANLAYLKRAIDDVVSGVHAERDDFAIMICSDHGQVVGACQGTEHPFDTVKQRLRVATGDRRENEVDLKSAMTMCDRSYYALADGTAWSQSGGPVFGCHGGVFPEEVITRVSVLTLAPRRHEFHVTANGKGISGVSGTVSWKLVNLSDVEVTIMRLRLSFGDRSVHLEPPLRSVRPRACWEASDYPVNEWPSEMELATSRIEVELSVSGTDELLTATGPAQITSEDGYESNDFQL